MKERKSFTWLPFTTLSYDSKDKQKRLREVGWCVRGRKRIRTQSKPKAIIQPNQKEIVTPK